MIVTISSSTQMVFTVSLQGFDKNPLQIIILSGCLPIHTSVESSVWLYKLDINHGDGSYRVEKSPNTDNAVSVPWFVLSYKCFLFYQSFPAL